MIVVATAGHVDHGKSTLIQRLTGIDPDRLAEEKRRGLTIDLGFAWTRLPGDREIGFVDVPGHERFLANMLAGVGNVPAVLFVVDASEGWKLQSEEHLAILDLLEVTHGIVALTKSDLVQMDQLETRTVDVRARLAGTCLAEAPILAVSAATGDGIDALTNALITLHDAVPLAPEARTRLWVDRAFTIRGAGTVATGTLAEGSLAVGDEVTVHSAGVRARIRGLESHKQHRVQVEPGARVAVNLAGLERTDLARGDTLLTGDAWLDVARIVVRLRTVRGLERPLRSRSGYQLYAGTAEVQVRLTLLEGRTLKSGASGFASCVLSTPLPLVPLDRVVLRDTGSGRVVAGGRVLDTGGGRFPMDVLERLEACTGRDEVARIVLEVEGIIDRAGLLARSGALAVPVDAIALGDTVVHRFWLDCLRSEARAMLDAFHASEPLLPGMPIDTFRVALEAFDPRLSARVATLEALAPEVVTDGTVVRQATFQPSVGSEHDDDARRALADVRAGGLDAKDRATLDESYGRKLIEALIRRGDLVQVGKLCLDPSAFADARDRILTALAQQPMTTSEIRQLLQTSRRVAIPLLEHLDAEGLTRFDGDRRKPA